MTRKDYVLIAEVLKAARKTSKHPEELDYAISALCVMFAKDNNRFDRERFCKACGA